MKRLLQTIALFTLLLSLPGLADFSDMREEMRAQYQKIHNWSEGLFEEEPSITPPYRTGQLLQGAQEDALRYLNFLRSIAGLAPVSLSSVYGMYAQHAAVLLAASGQASHDPVRPADMDEDFFRTAHTGAARGNLAIFGWSDDNLLRKGILYLLRDEGERNLPNLGHRRWVLSPQMGETGFGFALGPNQNGVAVLYAVDDSQSPDWDQVAWPSGGAFPAEFLSADTPWSVSLNPAHYCTGDKVLLILREKQSGAVYEFSFDGASHAGYSTISNESYGVGPCLIFRPNLAQYGMHTYEQNQIWQVEILGLLTPDGNPITLQYQVELMSLYPEPAVSVELSQTTLSLAPGDWAALTALVLPRYADDCRVTWHSSNPAIAQVDENGLVTAFSPGTCTITARNSAGREDACQVTVE